jgi:hypothetical protein
MIIRLDNLNAGIEWWRKNQWEPDFLNADYDKIYAARNEGVTENWWSATVERLTRWHAFRGPKPPNTKASILQRGKDHLNEIAAQYARLVSAGEPSIADLCWEDVAPLFTIASRIKNSPVFAGKTCHFLFPKLFIVMDNEGTGVFEYEFCWRGMKDEWNRFKEKTEAESLLRKAIKSSPHRLYPFEIKIMELSQIGYNHG